MLTSCEHLTKYQFGLQASGGRDFAFNIPSPSAIATDVYGKYLCNAMRGAYTLVTEPGMICHLDQAAWFAHPEPRIIPFNCESGSCRGVSVARKTELSCGSLLTCPAHALAFFVSCWPAAVPEVDLHAPIVGSHRPTYLYFRSGCSNSSDRSSGMLQRYSFINSFVNKSADVQVMFEWGYRLAAAVFKRLVRLTVDGHSSLLAAG